MQRNRRISPGVSVSKDDRSQRAETEDTPGGETAAAARLRNKRRNRFTRAIYKMKKKARRLIWNLHAFLFPESLANQKRTRPLSPGTIISGLSPSSAPTGNQIMRRLLPEWCVANGEHSLPKSAQCLLSIIFAVCSLSASSIFTAVFHSEEQYRRGFLFPVRFEWRAYRRTSFQCADGYC